MILKLTRKAFNRKLVAFIVTALTSVALTTTGFVSFVISTNATTKQDGNIEIGTVAEASLEFADITISNDGNLVFEPVKDDDTGRVRYDGLNSENLTITITGKLYHSEYLSYLGISLALPQGAQYAVEAGYILAPQCAYEEQVIGKRSDYTASASGIISFTYTFSFGWGEKFGYMNPSLYFDTAAGKELYSDEEVVLILQEFRKLVYGIDDPNLATDELPIGSNIYEITLTAYVN